MSERKSAEIKFRCTPSFKAMLQAAATASDQSLTEYLESAVWAHDNAKLDGTVLIGTAIEALREIGAGESGAVAELQSVGWGTPPAAIESLLDTDDLAVIAADASSDDEEGGAERSGLAEFIRTNIAEAGPPLTREALDRAAQQAAQSACTCRPWEYCTHKSA